MFEIGCTFRTATEENVPYSDFFLFILSANLGKAEYKLPVVTLPRLISGRFFLTFSHFSNGGRKNGKVLHLHFLDIIMS